MSRPLLNTASGLSWQDTTPPISAWAGELPLAKSPAATAAFNWTAQDVASVSFTCTVQVESTQVIGEVPAQTSIAVLSANGPALNWNLTSGVPVVCTPPLLLYWLQPGAPSSLPGG